MANPRPQRTGSILRRPHRMQELLRVLSERGSLHLSEAASLLAVSEMTVRRDIAEHTDLITYLGGHLLAADGVQGSGRHPRYTLSDEEKSHTSAKIAVATQAAALIRDGDTLFIDCGSTTPHLASRIPRGVRATVVCYALNVAEILCRNNDLRVVLLGGLWHSSTASFSSDENLALISKLGINKAFISAAGVDVTRGVSCVHFHEVAIKQAAMARSVEKYLIVDASKFGQVKPAFFARTSDFDRIICDDALPPEFATDEALQPRLLLTGK